MSDATGVVTLFGRANDRQSIVLQDESDLAGLVALARLPSLTPSRLWSLIELGRPSATWKRVAGGGAPRQGRQRDVAEKWAGWSSLIDPSAELARHELAGVHIAPFGHPGYPDALLDDPDPPAVIFRQGPAPLDDRARVAIVGTRRCTPYGRLVAHDLGAALAGRGVDVVSGLASGIDAAAHAGAISKNQSRTVAVVAGGVDNIYPNRNRGLYRDIAAQGALLSEWPLGSPSQPWRFPARNRIVAALAAAVVVVESGVKGGSMYTVDEALQRNRAVFAVPGSIRSPVSKGTNKLIADGAHALYEMEDLLDAVAPPPKGKPTEPTRTPIEPESWLLEFIGWEPTALDNIVSESGRGPSDVTLECERLIGAGVLCRRGGVIERVA